MLDRTVVVAAPLWTCQQQNTSVLAVPKSRPGSFSLRRRRSSGTRRGSFSPVGRIDGGRAEIWTKPVWGDRGGWSPSPLSLSIWPRVSRLPLSGQIALIRPIRVAPRPEIVQLAFDLLGPAARAMRKERKLRPGLDWTLRWSMLRDSHGSLLKLGTSSGFQVSGKCGCQSGCQKRVSGVVLG